MTFTDNLSADEFSSVRHAFIRFLDPQRETWQQAGNYEMIPMLNRLCDSGFLVSRNTGVVEYAIAERGKRAVCDWVLYND
jgi:DNA-binding PadR family transcriptional regulator